MNGRGEALSYIIRVALLCAVLCMSAGSVPAQEETDARLQTKVTIEVAGTQLQDVLKDLSEQTGVELKAGTSQREWRVAERKVTVVAKDVALGDLLDALVDLLDFHMSRGKRDGQFTYLIWQDKNGRELESSILTSQMAAFAERSVKARQGAIDAANEALNMTPEQAMAKAEEDPWLAYLGGTKPGRGMAKIMSAIGSDYPAARDLMFRGRRANIPLQDIPPDLYQGILDAADGGFLGQARKKQDAAMPDLSPSEIVIWSIEDTGQQSQMGLGGLVAVLGRPPDDAPGGDEMSFLGRDGVPMAMFPIASGESLTGQVFGRMFLAIESGRTMEQVQQELMAEFTDPDFMADAMGRESPTEQQPPADPALTREVEVGEIQAISSENPFDPTNQVEKKGWQAVAEATGMPVLVESYRSVLPVGMLVKKGKQPLYQILIGLEKGGYIWEFKEDMLLVRPEDWALRRSWDIFSGQIAEYKAILEKEGYFNLDRLSQIASELTDGQIQNTLVVEPDLSLPVAAAFSNPMGSSKPLLRIYGSLTPAQKNAINSDEGLEFSQLSDSQWETLDGELLNEVGGVEIMGGSIKLEPASESSDSGNMEMRNFEITVFVAGEEEPRTLNNAIMIAGPKQIQMMKDMVNKQVEQMKKKQEGDKQREEGAQPVPETAPQPAPVQ